MLARPSLARQPTMSLAVPRPEIPEVLNLETGEYLSLEQVVSVGFSDVIRLRTEIKKAQLQGQPLFVCSECGVPVSLLMHPSSRAFYFKHTLEDGRCSAITKGDWTQDEINARKYNGAKESRLHLRMKELIVNSLAADPQFHSVEIEERWADAFAGEWRKPDVRAVYIQSDGTEVAVVFEVQLSTTFLDVIVERREFYLRNGGLLFWVFADFPNNGRRLTQDDVFYNNNHNAFLVGEDTKIASDELSEFCLTCVWSTPSSKQTDEALQRKTVSFRDLTLDVPGQRAYFFDFDKARKAMDSVKEETLSTLRDTFEIAWIHPERNGSQLQEFWKQFYGKIAKKGIRFREFSGPPPPALVDALYSAKYGEVIGWKYKKFIEVAHRMASAHPQFLQLFRKALHVYDRGAQLSAEDRSKKWAERVKSYRAAIKRGEPRYICDVQYDETLIILFPELFEDSLW